MGIDTAPSAESCSARGTVGRRRKEEQRRAGADIWNLGEQSPSHRQGLQERAKLSKRLRPQPTETTLKKV
jgi:hypothetical protein